MYLKGSAFLIRAALLAGLADADHYGVYTAKQYVARALVVFPGSDEGGQALVENLGVDFDLVSHSCDVVLVGGRM